MKLLILMKVPINFLNVVIRLKMVISVVSRIWRQSFKLNAQQRLILGQWVTGQMGLRAMKKFNNQL